MSEFTCQVCGSEYRVGAGFDGEFTTITVSYHDSDRDDWSESVCADCGDDLLEAVVAEVRDDE